MINKAESKNGPVGPLFYDFTHFHGIMGGLFIEKIKRRQEWIKNITVKSYGRKINTWC